MVGATYYYADARDEDDLLDYLREGTDVTLRPWPLLHADRRLTRVAARSTPHVLVVSAALGEPAFIGDGDGAMRGGTASAVFNRLNLQSVQAVGRDAIVDFNASPVLLWEPGSFSASELTCGSIGTQADSPNEISADYFRWVQRVAAWIRRRGTPVWGLGRSTLRPDLTIDIPLSTASTRSPGR